MWDYSMSPNKESVDHSVAALMLKKPCRRAMLSDKGKQSSGNQAREGSAMIHASGGSRISRDSPSHTAQSLSSKSEQQYRLQGVQPTTDMQTLCMIVT